MLDLATGEPMGHAAKSSADDYETVVASSVETFSGGATCPRHGVASTCAASPTS